MKITRRGFISMLALAGAGAVLTPNRKIFLPTAQALPPLPELPGFHIENLRYSAVERYSHGFTDWKGVYGSADLTEATLADSLEDLAKRGISVRIIKPSRMLVHPDKVEAANAAFPGQVEPHYFADPNAWYLKTDAQDMKMASLLERHALAAGIKVRRA